MRSICIRIDVGTTTKEAEYRRRLGHTVGSGDRDTTVHMPEKSDAADEPETQPKDQSARESILIDVLPAGIGDWMGRLVWMPRPDRARSSVHDVVPGQELKLHIMAPLGQHRRQRLCTRAGLVMHAHVIVTRGAVSSGCDGRSATPLVVGFGSPPGYIYWWVPYAIGCRRLSDECDGAFTITMEFRCQYRRFSWPDRIDRERMTIRS